MAELESTKLSTGEILTFDPEAHAYRINDEPCEGIHALMERYRVCKPMDEHARAYAERGTRVHLACAIDDEGDFDETSAWAKSEEYGYLQAWRQYKAYQGIEKFDSVEKLIGSSEFWYATKIDRLHGAGVIEIKTGQPYKHHPIQLALEGILAFGVTAFQRHGVYLAGDGTYKVEDYTLDTPSFNIARAIVSTNASCRAWVKTRRKPQRKAKVTA